MKIVAIASGGMIGAILRFWIGLLLFEPEALFPFPTLFINLGGTFILGWFVVYGTKLFNSKTLILGIQTGFLGSFTTFSTFSVELVLLLEKSFFEIALLYFVISALGGITAILLGIELGSRLAKKAGAEQ
ncbi:fluoride efflux transporter CrcB [Fictibacillus nanhaiensis]|uniref:fluoride efflux transporter CrcB n=1 Tax=Fictibacillus nanhaiensis TaxID=742169 RepID=UPI0030B7FBA7